MKIAFITSENESKEFEVQPLVLKNMPDHVNIGIRFMRQLQLQINYDEAIDDIWSPILGKLKEDPTGGVKSKVCNVYERGGVDNLPLVEPR